MSVYEKSRQERIKQNLQRMHKLGLFHLSSKLNSPKPKPPRRIRTTTQPSPPLLPSSPIRRSSRLQNVNPVTYVEEELRSKKRGRTQRLLRDEDVKLEVGSKLEVYTEEHEKLLGNTERSWTLFVDGCGKDGRRIYDQINGKTCHQCRQKTLGYRTHCSRCQMVQGQFCGDCLYMRYGEHVLEALENPEWICPVCRGICNCSLCRQAKGWAPTGALYRKISNLGYKSVAHYLIQTQRAQNDMKEKCLTINQVSTKRSLPFSDTEAPLKDSPEFNNKLCQLSEPGCNELTLRTLQLSSEKLEHAKFNCIANYQCGISNCEFKGKEEKESKLDGGLDSDMKLKTNMLSETVLRGKKQMSNNRDCTNVVDMEKFLPFSSQERSSKNVGFADVKHEINELQSPKHTFEDKTEKDCQGKKERELHSTDKGHGGHSIAFMSCPKHKEKCMSTTEPSQDSIATRLMQRRRSSNEHANVESTFFKEETVILKQVVTNELCDEAAKNRKEMDIKRADGITLQNGLKSKEKADSTNEPNPDSIGGRLRQRRRMSKREA